MNIAMITDLHFGVRSDSKIFHQIFEDYYTNKFIPEIERRGIKTVVILGDVFDRRKHIVFETLELARRVLFGPLAKLGCKVHVITGNHDVVFKNTNSLNSLSLLLNSFDNVTVYDAPTEVVLEGERFLMLPWINKENTELAHKFVTESDARFVVSHLELVGFEYHRGYFSEHGHIDPDLLGRFEFVFSGHYHHKSSRGNIHYLGTPYELTWADYDTKKGFHTFDGRELSYHSNPSANFVQLIYSDENQASVKAWLNDDWSHLANRFVKIIIRKRDNNKLYERFFDVISDVYPADLSVVDETTYLVDVEDENAEPLPTDTLDVVRYYVDNILETDLSKDVLKRKLQALYIEANRISGVE